MRARALILPLLQACLVAVGAVAVTAAPAAAIVNGIEATDGAFGWTVALVAHGEAPAEGQFCGGTLIAPNRVLTAAHCTYEGGPTYDSLPPTAIDVLANQTSLTAEGCVGTCGDNGSRDYTVGQRIAVSQISRHSLARVNGDEIRYDLAILTLAEPVPGAKTMTSVETGADAIVPAADENIGIDPSSPQAGGWGPGTNSYAFGWGKRNITTNGGSTNSGVWSYPDVLRWVTAPAAATPAGSSRMERLDDAYCQSRYPVDFHPEDMLCAGPVNATTNKAPDACNGDSGGPLLRKSMLPEYDLRPGNPPDDPGIDPARQAQFLNTVSANWRLLGVVSWGPADSCGDPQLPGVYVRVGAPAIASYIDDANPAPSPSLASQETSPTITGSYRSGTISCNPGTWQHATSFEYVMWRDTNGDKSRAGADETLLTGGNTGKYHPTTADTAGRTAGAQIGCVVTARGPGGYATAQATSLVDLSIPSAVVVPTPTPTPAPTVDRLKPRLLKDYVVCGTSSCKVSVFAADTGAGASGLRKVTAKLIVKRRVTCKPAKQGKRCTKQLSRTVGLKTRGELRSATVRQLRRADANSLQLRAYDVAGNSTLLTIKLKPRAR